VGWRVKHVFQAVKKRSERRRSAEREAGKRGGELTGTRVWESRQPTSLQD